MQHDRNGGPSRRRLLETAGALGAGVLAAPFVSRGARAAWPTDRPIRIIVANTPGGPSDIAARLIAPALQEALGASVIVENRGGGGGNIGILAVSRSEPDGYTLHLATSVFVINPSLYDPPPYDPLTDLLPVAELAVSPSLFVAKPDVGADTMMGVVELAKRDQDKFNLGSPTVGSTLHLGAELLKHRYGLEKVALVIYPGGGQAIQAVLADTVQLCSTSLAPAHAHIQSGALRGLAILGEQRWHDLPDVPTAEEAGLKDFNFETFTALMAPPKTPPEIIKAIEKATVDVLQNPALREKFTKAGFLVTARGTAEFAARIQREVPRFREIIKTANIKVK